MIYRKEEQEDGDYIDREGTRWAVSCLRRIRTPEGVNVGWTEFQSLEAALEEWGMTYAPLPEPQPEN